MSFDAILFGISTGALIYGGGRDGWAGYGIVIGGLVGQWVAMRMTINHIVDAVAPAIMAFCT